MKDETICAIVITFIMTMLGTLILVGNFGMRNVLTFYDIAFCAVQENPDMRETTGVATYNVTFQNGDWVEITCQPRW